MSQTRPILIWLALVAVYLIWGSTYLGIRIVSASLPPLGSAAARFALAGLVLAGLIALRNGLRPLRLTAGQLAACALVGVLLITGGNGLVVIAESPAHALASGLAALLIALNPLLMVLLRAATGDRPGLLTVVGVVVGLVGLGLLFAPGAGGQVPVVGAVLVVVATVAWCGGSFATRWLPMPPSPFVASAYQMAAGAVALGVLSLVRGEHLDPAAVPARAWFALGYLILAGSLIAFTAYVYLLSHAPISLVTTYAYVNPVIALGLGALLAGEALGVRVLSAAAIVLIGVAMVVSTEKVGRRAAVRR